MILLVEAGLAAAPAAAAPGPERAELEARVAAVRAALGTLPPEALPPLVALAGDWNNWPKWSKWSNWANQ